MRRFFEPAAAPPWLPQLLRSIRQALTDIWPAPLRLKDYATADLPAAAEHKQGLVYDGATGEAKLSDGSAWVALSTAGHSHEEEDLLLSATDRLVGRDAAGAGPAEELTVGGGLEFTGAGGLRRSALSGDVAAAAGSDAVTIAANAVSNAKLADMAEARIKGRPAAAGTGDPADLTAAEAKALLAIAAADVADFAEAVRDRVGLTLAAGTGISVTVDDAGDSITIASSVTQYSDEMAQDAVGSSLVDSATIDLSYDDAGGQISAAVRDDSIGYAKLQNVSATDRLLGRSSAGAGDVEEVACTAAGRSLIAAADAQAQRTHLRSGCMVRKSANETGINASAGGHFLSWDSEIYDDAGYHDNVVNNSRLTTLSGQTRVRVGCSIAFANVTAASQISVAIYRNGSPTYDGRPTLNGTTPTAILQPILTLCSGPIPVTGGTDYFQVGIYCSDTSIDVTTASNFWIEAC